MSGPNETPDDDKKWLRWLAIGVIIFIFLFGSAAFGGSVSYYARYQGENLTFGGAGGGGSSVSCAGVASVPAQYMPWVKEAAQQWLGGDEAALIALIQIESSWNPTATPGAASSAGGLGQFLTSTAKSMPEFRGGSDGKGRVWPAGKIYPSPAGHADEARFDPERAIFATAHYMNLGNFPKSRTLGEMYERHYHGYNNEKQHAAARAGRARLERVYSEVKQQNCTETSYAGGGGSGVVTGGKSCPVARGNAGWGSTTRQNPHTPSYPGHEGLDVFAARGTEIYSVTDGTVIRIGRAGGWRVFIKDPDGHYWFYQHMVPNEYPVRTGDTVKAGQLIGHMSDSGAEDRPVHLHIGIAKTSRAYTNGAQMNWADWYYPYDFLHDIPCLSRTLK